MRLGKMGVVMDVSVFRKIILANELGNDESLVCRFSDPDGVRSGKSGYSFGICQFDITNNPSAVLCLRECEFTTDEIAELKAQRCLLIISPLNTKLADHADVVAAWDERQLQECVAQPLALCFRSSIELADQAVVYHLADYHNQFYLSKGGKMHRFLMGLGRPVKSDDVLTFKLGLPWGQKRPDDVRRRYNNIVAIVGGEKA